MTLETKNPIDRATAQANFNQLLDEISEGQADKVVIQDDNTAAVIISLTDFQIMQDRLLAIELIQAVQEVKEADAKGDLLSWSELATTLGIERTNHPKPEGYDQLVPEKYRSAS